MEKDKMRYQVRRQFKAKMAQTLKRKKGGGWDEWPTRKLRYMITHSIISANKYGYQAQLHLLNSKQSTRNVFVNLKHLFLPQEYE